MTKALPGDSDESDVWSPSPAPAAPEVGDVVDGRYLVESVLGEGGMGIVFAARNLPTGREVALKYMIMRERSSRQERIARARRFVREAKAAGCIRHENVVDVFDAGGDPEAPYLVMERLHGQSLAERLRGGAMDQDHARAVVLEAARGVAAAHRQGVVHRDLKPENIFLARPALGEGPPSAKVLDFGVSLILSPNEPLGTITRAGGVVGTPTYMPLEQLRGDREIDPRVDVYALGVILYEALCARRPYAARTLHDLVLQMVDGQPEPIRQHRHDVNPRLEAIVMRCLAKDPRHRYRDAGELVDALEGRDVSEPLSRVVARLAPRRALLFGFGLLAVVLLIALRTAREQTAIVPPAASLEATSAPQLRHSRSEPPARDSKRSSEAPVPLAPSAIASTTEATLPGEGAPEREVSASPRDGGSALRIDPHRAAVRRAHPSSARPAEPRPVVTDGQRHLRRARDLRIEDF